MSAAPEMSPTLDEAIRALDRVLRAPGAPSSAAPPDLLRVGMFLDRLDEVRDVPPVLPNRDQAAILEGAYTAGYRCADESGHVLVVSLPAMLAFAGVPPARSWWSARLRPGLLALGGHVYPWGLALALLAVGLAGGGQHQAAWAAWAACLLVVFYSWAGSHATSCNQDCGQGDRCPSRSDVADEAAAWKARALEAESALQAQGLAKLVAAAETCPISGAPKEWLSAQASGVYDPYASQVHPDMALPSRRVPSYPPTRSGLASGEHTAFMRTCCLTPLEAAHSPACPLGTGGRDGC